MKKFAILITLIAAFAVAGCSSDDKPAAAPAQIPQAAPAQKGEQPKQLIKTDSKEQPGYVEMKGNGKKMAHF